MKWKTKALLQSTLSRFPFGESIYFSLQKRFGGFRNFNVLSKVTQGIEIIEILKENQIDLKNKRTCEIGTGWIPIIPTLLYIFGQESCITFDIQRLLKPELFIDTVRKISSLTNQIQNKIPWGWNEDAIKRMENLTESIPDYQKIFSIIKLDYLAPIIIPFEDIPSNSIDIVVSNTTLEHIPKNTLRDLLIASKRVIKPDGISVHLIDCSDHYSHSDSSISRINFLRYSETEWQRYNSRFLYQNRLRASDYRNMFDECGFEILTWRQRIPSKLKSLIVNFPIALDFTNYSNDDLTTTDIAVVARIRS